MPQTRLPLNGDSRDSPPRPSGLSRSATRAPSVRGRCLLGRVLRALGMYGCGSPMVLSNPALSRGFPSGTSPRQGAPPPPGRGPERRRLGVPHFRVREVSCITFGTTFGITGWPTPRGECPTCSSHDRPTDIGGGGRKGKGGGSRASSQHKLLLAGRHRRLRSAMPWLFFVEVAAAATVAGGESARGFRVVRGRLAAARRGTRAEPVVHARMVRSVSLR